MWITSGRSQQRKTTPHRSSQQLCRRFAAQHQATRDARLQKELKLWRDREERALERQAGQVQEARIEAIHARYVRGQNGSENAFASTMNQEQSCSYSAGTPYSRKGRTCCIEFLRSSGRVE